MSAKRLSLIASALALVLWSSSSHAQGQPPAALSGTVSSAKEGLMDRFAALVKREGANALVVALPEQGVFFDAKAAAGQHEALTEVLGCAAKAGLATLDTLAAFEKENVGRDIDTYYGMMHFTERGNAIAARAIAAALASSKE